MIEPVFFFDNNVARKIVGKNTLSSVYRKNICDLVRSKCRNSFDIVRTPSALLELAGLQPGNNFLSPFSVIWDHSLVQNPNTLRAHLEAELAKARTYYCSAWDEIRSHIDRSRSNWDSQDSFATSLVNAYFDKFDSYTPTSHIQEIFADCFASSALQIGLTHGTPVTITLSLYQSCLNENYGTIKYPLIVSPYRAVFWYALQTATTANRRAIDSCSLGTHGDLVDAEGVSLACLGHPTQEPLSQSVSIQPTIFITEDPVRKLLKRAKLFNEYHQKMFKLCQSISGLSFESGSIVPVCRNTGKMILELTEKQWR